MRARILEADQPQRFSHRAPADLPIFRPRHVANELYQEVAAADGSPLGESNSTRRHRSLEPVQVGRFEEQPAADREVVARVWHELAVREPPLLVERPVARVKDAAGHELV